MARESSDSRCVDADDGNHTCFSFRDQEEDALHRQWATRSYAIALVFIAGRFVMGVTGWEALGVEIVQAIIWSCLAMSVLLGDVAIHWKEISAAVSIPVKAEKKETVPRGVIRAT